MNKWIILHNAPTPEPAWFGDDDKPVVYDTREEAVREMVEDYISTLQQQLKEFLHDEREEIDLQCEEWVEPCTLHEDGVITTEMYDPLYDPKTFVR